MAEKIEGITEGEPGKKSHVCDMCPKAYPRLSHLIRHKRSHTGERPFTCHICQETFGRNEQVVLHIKRRHKGENPYKCIKCNQSFPQSSELMSHKKTHRKEIIHECNICMELFHTNGDLVVHTRKHTGERPFQCGVCGKAFARSALLGRHKTIHADKKLYSCDMCPKSFARSDNLLAHKRTHSTERAFSCDICGKSFKDGSYLINHKKVHTRVKPYSCEICQKPYASRKMLRVHIRSQHTGERPFKCDVCEKAFFKKQTMVRHMKTHTNERNYQCDSCGKQSARSTGLKSHKPTDNPGQHYECDACYMSFMTKACLRYHKKRHIAFKTAKILQKSQKTSQIKNKLANKITKCFDCNVCHLHFSSEIALHHHQKSDCQICNYKIMACGGQGLAVSTENLAELKCPSVTNCPNKCEACKKSFESSEKFKNHNCSEIKTELHCDFEPNVINAAQHMTNKSSLTQSAPSGIIVPHISFICYHCCGMFDSPADLENHLAEAHFDCSSFNSE